MDTIHPDVFPFDRQRTTVGDIIQCDNDILKMDVAVPDRTEVPITPVITEIGVTSKYADFARTVAPPDVFHVSVEDPILELANESYVVDSLVTEMRRIVVKPESAMMFHRVQSTMRRRDVERNLSRMYLEPEINIQRVKSLKDRQETFAKIVKPFLEEILARRRKCIAGLPDG